MTPHDPFDSLMTDAMRGADHFGHREHVRLTWLAVHRHGTATATRIVSDGIRASARYAGAPQKYNATVSRAWVECVAYHLAEQQPTADFDAFTKTNTALLDKRLLLRFYRSSTLASDQARTGWVPPDLGPCPWETENHPNNDPGSAR